MGRFIMLGFTQIDGNQVQQWAKDATAEQMREILAEEPEALAVFNDCINSTNDLTDGSAFSTGVVATKGEEEWEVITLTHIHFRGWISMGLVMRLFPSLI